MNEDLSNLIANAMHSENVVPHLAEETVEFYCNKVVFAVEEMIHDETQRKLNFIQNHLGRNYTSPRFNNAPIVNFVFYK